MSQAEKMRALLEQRSLKKAGRRKPSRRAMRPASIAGKSTIMTIPDIDAGAWSYIDQPELYPFL